MAASPQGRNDHFQHYPKANNVVSISRNKTQTEEAAHNYRRRDRQIGAQFKG
jgi:hypothetical protein